MLLILNGTCKVLEIQKVQEILEKKNNENAKKLRNFYWFKNNSRNLYAFETNFSW